MYIIIVYFGSIFFVKFLIILVYVRGVVVFILYISCICWLGRSELYKSLFFLGVVVIFIYD